MRERETAPAAHQPAAYDELVLVTALQDIAGSYDCEDLADDRPCGCPSCSAKAALAELKAWRFRAVLPERLVDGFHPREAAIVDSFRKEMAENPDRFLGMIIKAGDVSVRDWHVAISVVQWLATNCGMAVLERAGFVYTRFDEDRREREARRPTTLLPTPPVEP